MENFSDQKKTSSPKGFRQSDLIKGLSLVSHMGIVVVVCLGMGFFGGRWLDTLTGTSPLFLLIFSFVGMGAAFKALYDMAKKM